MRLRFRMILLVCVLFIGFLGMLAMLSNSAVQSVEFQQQARLHTAEVFVQQTTPETRRQDPRLVQLANYLQALPGNMPPECKVNQTLFDRKASKGLHWPPDQSNSWYRFYSEIHTCYLYPENSRIAAQVMLDLATLPIINVTMLESGTQVKLILTFNNNMQALVKPIRYGIEYETHPNHFYFSDYERANAEIVAFHLDRALGFRRVPPTIGRRLDLRDIRVKAQHSLARTFFISPVNNLCFTGKCDYYCDTTHAICGEPYHITASVQMFLPDEAYANRHHVKSKYRRTYSKKEQLADWQKDNTYCTYNVKNHEIYATDYRRLLDLIDLHIFDYMGGNLDRHHFEVLEAFHDPAYPVHLDNGRAFGRSWADYEDILAPLYQCCVIRPSTLRMLLSYYTADKKNTLSEVLRRSMAVDPIAPVLAEKHYPALERRLEKILRHVADCIDKNNGDHLQVLRTEFLSNDWVESEPESDE